MPQFFDEYAPIDQREHRLPHWQQDDVACFITWRLNDALPTGVAQQWRVEREAWLRHHPHPWDDATEHEYHQRFSENIERLLDQGSGSCLLRASENARIVAAAFMRFNGDCYEMDAFVVMPNHVHVLFRPNAPHTLSKIVKGWKGSTARELNLSLGRSGPLWQEDYWDRLLRSEEH